MKPTRNAAFKRWLVAGVVVTVLGAAIIVSVTPKRHDFFVRRSTIGDLEVIHSTVLVGAAPQLDKSRVAAGDRISTEAAGRAQLRLANGVRVLMDASSEVTLGATGIELLRGRLFVDSPEGKKIDVVLGLLTAPLSASKVAFERAPDGQKIRVYCAQGEVMVVGSGAPTRVPSGETLTLDGGKISVEPEKAFDDWTGGLAVPWATKPLSRSALAEAWVSTDAGEPLAALHVSSQDVQVELVGEFALTRSKTRYYNGNDQTVTPNLRLALPPNAILTSVAHQLSTDPRSTTARLANCRSDLSNDVAIARLEWAGNGWLTGRLPPIGAGASVDLELEYGQWLPASSGTRSYRYPIGRGDEFPLIGELAIGINAEQSGAISIEANQGATVDGKRLLWRASDIKPSDDWEVRYPAVNSPADQARAYVESFAVEGDPNGPGDPYVMVRAETAPRPAASVQMAIVVDSSRSMGPSGLDLARQIVDALLGNLSPEDRVVVFTADEEVKGLGSATPRPNDSALRQLVVNELAKIRSGGASHLGNALERAADALDGTNDPATNRLLVYLGDGRPSLGELTADRIRAQLQRRANGIPRMAAIAVGPSADRWLLARLVSGSGPVHTVLDRSEAAAVASNIVSAAQASAYRDVKFDLGPGIDRIYPREGRTIAAGTTATVVGRLRGALPSQIQLSYRDGTSIKTELLRVQRHSSPRGGEVARRWALARIEEMVSGDEGIQPALVLGQRHRLLLPWSEWVLEPSQQGERVPCTSFSRRIVELSTLNDTPYARRIEEPVPTGGGWLEPPLAYDPGDSLEQGAIASAKARIESARATLVACRDARLPVTPNLPNGLGYRITLGATGRPDRITITPKDGGKRDSIFLGCVERVILSQQFVGAERPITVEGSIDFPAPRGANRTQCSTASGLPLPLRRNLWSTRTGDALSRYEFALRSCEIGTWIERRELLRLLAAQTNATSLLQVADSFLNHGHTDAATFLRNEAAQRIATLDELKQFRSQVLRSEPNLDAEIATKVRRANTDEQRLAVVTRALTMAPHSPLGRRLQLLLLERLDQKIDLQREIEALRRDPFTDAGLMALAAAALRRQGQAAEAQRSFSELFERAPRDPWVLAFAGDQLRIEGFAEQAILAYENLERVTPNDTATLLRVGLAQAAAGRVDIASRLLDRAAQTAGRSDDHRLNELGAVLRAVVLGRAQGAATNPSEQLELGRRLAQTALPDVAAIVLVEAPAGIEQGITVRATRGDDRIPIQPELDATPLGLVAIFVDRGAQSLQVEVTRRTLAGLGRALPVTLSVLFLGENPSDRRLRTVTSEIATDQPKTTMPLSAELRP